MTSIRPQCRFPAAMLLLLLLAALHQPVPTAAARRILEGVESVQGRRRSLASLGALENATTGENSPSSPVEGEKAKGKAKVKAKANAKANANANAKAAPSTDSSIANMLTRWGIPAGFLSPVHAAPPPPPPDSMLAKAKHQAANLGAKFTGATEGIGAKIGDLEDQLGEVAIGMGVVKPPPPPPTTFLGEVGKVTEGVVNGVKGMIFSPPPPPIFTQNFNKARDELDGPTGIMMVSLAVALALMFYCFTQGGVAYIRQAAYGATGLAALSKPDIKKDDNKSGDDSGKKLIVHV